MVVVVVVVVDMLDCSVDTAELLHAPTIISYTISPSINLDTLHSTINGIF
jgi:hypothetical protein